MGTCVLGLGQGATGREYLRNSCMHEVMSAWMTEETDNNTKYMLTKALRFTHLSEDELLEWDEQQRKELKKERSQITEGYSSESRCVEITHESEPASSELGVVAP